MKRRNIIIAIILILLFIWIHSAISERASYRESLWITENVLNPLLKLGGIGAADKDLVRKVAHVLEFLILSIFTSCFWRGNIVRTIYTGLTIALIDETIQVVTKRGALITDIWIDMIGVGAGALIGFIVSKAFNHRNENQNKKYDS